MKYIIYINGRKHTQKSYHPKDFRHQVFATPLGFEGPSDFTMKQLLPQDIARSSHGCSSTHCFFSWGTAHPHRHPHPHPHPQPRSFSSDDHSPPPPPEDGDCSTCKDVMSLMLTHYFLGKGRLGLDGWMTEVSYLLSAAAGRTRVSLTYHGVKESYHTYFSRHGLRETTSLVCITLSDSQNA